MKLIQTITSIKDERIVQARELSTAAGRKKWNACLLEGEEILGWALEAGLSIQYVFCEPKRATESTLVQKMLFEGIACFSVSEGILKKISDTHYVIPIIGVAALPEVKKMDWGNFVLVLDDVRDHGNIGTIFRTAKAFGLRNILSTSPGLDIYYKKTIEASRGTVFSTQFENYPSVKVTLEALKSRGYQIIATSPRGTAIQSAIQLQDKPTALVIGNETNGVSEEIFEGADLIVQIPMSSQVESLNVGVAAGISLYEIKIKVVMQMLVKFIRQTLGREVNVAAQLVKRAFDVRLRFVGPYNSTQTILMMVLKCDEQTTLEQISRDIGVWGAELDALLQPLLDGGELLRGEDGIFRLSEKGDTLLAQIWGVLEASEAEIFSGFSADEQERFLNDLQRIQKNCITVLDRAGQVWPNLS